MDFIGHTSSFCEEVLMIPEHERMFRVAPQMCICADELERAKAVKNIDRRTKKNVPILQSRDMRHFDWLLYLRAVLSAVRWE